MNRFNFNIKDRKTLSLVLCLVLICVFTLTVAYSALTTILTINGNARVSAADWDIYLNNPRVTSGSATTNVPEIKTSSTLEFSTTLNMPGDFYEFVVDVVNAGDIDAMIENVVKTPDLTAEQAKFLKYEVSYQNGEAITKKQTLAKDTTMPIKVRIEYRKDLNNTDLPTGQVVLDLALTLEYIQSDGTGSSVNNNGAKIIFANGDINDIGTIVTIGSEQFYTIGTEGDNVKLFAMYNLYVGNSVDENSTITPLESPTGKQGELAKGYVDGESYRIGTIAFSTGEKHGTNYSSFNGSNIEEYVNNYKNILQLEFGVEIKEAKLISLSELTSDEIGCTNSYHPICTDAPEWVYSTSYWTCSNYDSYVVWTVYSTGSITAGSQPTSTTMFGVRPVIVISKDYFN